MKNKNTHGGKRAGAGMKPTGVIPKKTLGIKVDAETKTHLVKLHKTKRKLCTQVMPKLLFVKQ